MSTNVLRWAATAFAVVALSAGGLQLLAYGATGDSRRVIVGVFALAVGVSVLVAVIRRRGQNGDSQR